MIFMGLFDSMKDNMERRQRTREYLKSAKEYINDGEELYQNAYEKVLRRADKTRDAIRKHVEYKKDISRRLGEKILPTIENFQVPDLTAKIDPPFIDGKKAGLTTFSNSFASAVCMNPIPIPSIMDLFVSEEDYLEARNQRDEAKQFKQQMKYERERLYEYKDRMSMITSAISEDLCKYASCMGGVIMNYSFIKPILCPYCHKPYQTDFWGRCVHCKRLLLPVKY